MSDWKALAGRLTFFRRGGPSPEMASAQMLFRNIWELDPDQFQKNPNPPWTSFAQGVGRKLVRSCSVQPMRIDFNLSPVVPPQDTTPTLVMIEDLKEFHSELKRMIGKVRDGRGPESVNRVAFFVHFATVEPNFEAVNKALLSVMPNQYRTNLGTEEDFTFQVNRPQASLSEPRIGMNFITKWSADRVQILLVTLPTVVAAGQSQTTSTAEVLCASVAFDCNNMPMQDSLSSETQASLLHQGMEWVTRTQRESLSITDFSDD